ncbi:MAG: protein TolQ [Bdellovibrionota bacterium]
MKKINSLLFISVSLFLSVEMAMAQTQASTNVAVKMGALESIMHASLIVQVVIMILISLSIMCWGIAWNKYQDLKQVQAANKTFDTMFWKSTSLDELNEKIDAYKGSSHARVFKAAYIEMKKIAESPMLNKNLNSETEPPLLSGLDNLERSMRKAIENEVTALESRLIVLASTGSTGPFIGLFGTVWGIMSSFQMIGQTGSASLAAVAPGISEALVTTAIGLAAAIPAVMMYNHFIAEIKREESYLNNFSSDFLNIVKRNFFRG